MRRLAEQLDVSFIPIRDALRVLEAEGLVVNPPGRSASVAPLDLEEFHAIYRVRRLAARLLAHRTSPESNLEVDMQFLTKSDLQGVNVSHGWTGYPDVAQRFATLWGQAK